MIPLVKTRYATPFVTKVIETTGSSGRLFRQSGLTEALLDNPEARIPIHQFANLVRQSVIVSDNWDMGWYAARSLTLNDYGELGIRLLGTQILADRIRWFCRLAGQEYSLADFKMERVSDGLKFSRGPIAGDDIERRQTELYILFMMMDTLRGVLGSTWSASRIFLQTFPKDSLDSLLAGMTRDVRFDQKETAIFIQTADLASNLTGFSEPDGLDTDSGPGERPGCQMVQDVEDLILTYLSDPRLSQSFLSDISGLHPRQLQRLLQASGTNFRDLLKQKRMELAIEMLKDPGVQISEISGVLGYSEHAHFTRAFKELTGVSPRQFRKHNCM